MATIGFIIVGETCGGCGKPWAQCECLKNAVVTVGSTAWVCPTCGRDATRCDCPGSTGDIYAWDFWDNDEDAVYDETP